VAVAPRLVAGLLKGAWLPHEVFAGTTISVPARGTLRDALTGEEREIRGGKLDVSELFSTLPVALLVT
jgi:maltooligosyltrehalose synthase